MKRSISSIAGGTLALALLSACGGGEEEAPQVAQEVPVAAAPAAMPASGQDVATGSLLDPDRATREELLAIPGMDEATADAMITGRPYGDMAAVDRVLAGRFTEEQRDSVYTRLWKPLDLNTASAEEILLIPGVGARMQHEFEEYRPYRGIEQFRREIGKYVDDEEVARLEQYVTIR